MDIKILNITGGSMFKIKSPDDFVSLSTGDNLEIRLLAKYTDTILDSRQNLRTEKLSLLSNIANVPHPTCISSKTRTLSC